MLKKPLFICFLLSSLISFSQQIVKEFDFKLEKKRDFFQIVNESKKEVVLLLNDKEKVTSIRFDEKFGIKDSLSATRPERIYEEIIGYSQNENDYFVFWGSKDRKKINSQYFNFITKESKTNPINLELKKEKVIKELTIKNVFYLITIVKNTSILKLYISDNNGNLIEKTIDLSHLEFKNMYNNRADLYTVLTDESSEPCFQNISNDSPPSLALSAKRYKIYTYSPDEIIFTMDNTANATQILRINLQNLTSDLKSIVQPKIEKGQYGSLQFKSNSFLIDDKILQLKTNSFVLFVTISDLNGTKIKEYKVLHDQEIDFKNSDFVQESNGIHNQKLIENTEKFLRKIHNFPSISCYKVNGLYCTILGSSVDKTHASGGGGMGISGIGVGAGGMVPISYGSYTVENLISYKDKIVFYTNCLFDSNFNHVKGEIKSSAFDKARAFIEENTEIHESVTPLTTSLYKDLILFKYNTNLYLGNYNKKNKKYQIFSFGE